MPPVALHKSKEESVVETAEQRTLSGITVKASTPFGGSLGLCLFGMPARGPSRPLLVGYRVAALALGPPLPGAGVPTDPQSPKGGSQRACPTRGAHPTASGRTSSVALVKQSYPALAVRKLSLWVASPGDMSEPPFSDRSLGRRPSVTLFQRGSALLSHSVRVFIGLGRW